MKKKESLGLRKISLLLRKNDMDSAAVHVNPSRRWVEKKSRRSALRIPAAYTISLELQNLRATELLTHQPHGPTSQSNSER